MLQLATASATQQFSNMLATNAGLLWLLLFIVFASIGVGLLFILRPIFHTAHRFDVKNVRKLLLVTIPKEQSSTQSGGDDRIDAIREQISVAESLFSAIGGLKAQKGLLPWLRGRTDHFAFEIVVQKGIISFYVAVPPKMHNYIEEQLHAQYPDAHIESVNSYNIFSSKCTIFGSYLKLGKSDAFPIKTYKKMESDPLSAITNPLAKVEKEDGAAIQFIVRSAPKKWRSKGISIAKQAKQGKGINAKKSGIMGEIGKELKSAVTTSGGDGSPPKPEEPKQLTQMEEEQVRGIEEKASRAGMDINARIIVASQDSMRGKRYLDNIINAFSQYNHYEFGNTIGAIMPGNQNRIIRDFMYRSFDEKQSVTLNTEEMASLFHLPLPSTETPGIRWLGSRTAPPPHNLPQEGVELGICHYRGEEYEIRMKRSDRRRHFYIIGKSGGGKTVIMKNMVKQDIANGEGVCVLDPHGDFAEFALSHIPENRIDDVIYFCPSDMKRPMGLNMLEAKTEDEKDFLVQEMISIFYQLFPPEMIGPMFEHYMRNVMLTLMSDIDNPGTIAEIPRMFTDDEYAAKWVKKLRDPVVRAFWEKEMSQQTQQTKSDMLGYLISKVGRFVENEMMRNIVGQSRSAFDFREVMDKQKILIINLAKGTTGEVNASLLGMIIVAKLQMAALGRTDMAEDDRKDFFLYMDEFHNFITPSIATILSEARKYKLDLIMAHQYLGQLGEGGDTQTKDAVLGNAGSICCYRIGPEDSEILSKEFEPTFTAHDLMNPPEHSAYIKLLIDGKAGKPFNIKSPFYKPGDEKLMEGMKELSRLKYGRDRRMVEADIMERTQLGSPAPKAQAEIGKAGL